MQNSVIERRPGHHPRAKLAFEVSGLRMPLQVLPSAAGWYIGAASEELGPVSRESLETWSTREAAVRALETDDWNQREEP